MGLILKKPFTVERSRAQRQVRAVVRTPLLSVIIVNYHQWDNTAALVRQLRTAKTMQRQTGEVLVVDNHSPAHPIVRRLRRTPGVSLRRWSQNRGFARAVNEGCRLSQGEWVLLLNPDMTLPDGFLDQVQALAERLSVSEPRLGIVGLGLCNTDGSRQLSAGSFPSFWSTLAGLLLPRRRRKYRALNNPQPVDWVTGCAMLIRRECLQELGGFDSDFFLYYEDVDFCRRARSQGWHISYNPNIQAIHHNPLHRRRVPTALRLVTRHSLLTYAHKHWPRWQFRLLACIIQTEAALRRQLAARRGRSRAAALFERLGHIAGDMLRGRHTKARQRIMDLARKQQFYADE